MVKPEDESTAPTVHELTINGNPQQAQTLKLPKPMAQGGTTGTVMVFCTPDAQRSFLSCIPNDEVVVLTPELLQAAARSRLLVIEGYLFDLPGASEALPALVEAAKAAGTVVALTMGDAGVGEWVRGRDGGRAIRCWVCCRKHAGVAWAPGSCCGSLCCW